MNRQAFAAGLATVREAPAAGDLPLWTHPGWQADLPWLVQGLTVRGIDLALFGAGASGDVQAGWRRLMQATGCAAAVHARQVHGARVVWHHEPPPGLRIIDEADGHATASPGLLVAVSVADCVPVSIVDEERRAISLLHAGWRGTAAGVLEAGIERLRQAAGSAPARLRIHLGPAICGRCYEVGPEVFDALGLPPPHAPAPLDLRAVLADRAINAGVPPDRVGASEHCTRCSPGLHSHRGGDAGRQIVFLAVRE